MSLLEQGVDMADSFWRLQLLEAVDTPGLITSIYFCCHIAFSDFGPPPASLRLLVITLG